MTASTKILARRILSRVMQIGAGASRLPHRMPAASTGWKGRSDGCGRGWPVSAERPLRARLRAQSSRERRSGLGCEAARCHRSRWSNNQLDVASEASRGDLKRPST